MVVEAAVRNGGVIGNGTVSPHEREADRAGYLFREELYLLRFRLAFKRIRTEARLAHESLF